jgi:hypothetical protein
MANSITAGPEPGNSAFQSACINEIGANENTYKTTAVSLKNNKT